MTEDLNKLADALSQKADPVALTGVLYLLHQEKVEREREKARPILERTHFRPAGMSINPMQLAMERASFAYRPNVKSQSYESRELLDQAITALVEANCADKKYWARQYRTNYYTITDKGEKLLEVLKPRALAAQPIALTPDTIRTTLVDVLGANSPAVAEIYERLVPERNRAI